MPLPGVTVVQSDGNLGITPGTSSQVPVLVGTCLSGAPATLYSIGNLTAAVNALGGGKLLEDVAFFLEVAGGPLYAMPALASIAGAFATPTKTGAGAGTLALSGAPHEAVTVKITTGGALNTAYGTVQIGTGPVSAPILLPTGGVVAFTGTYAVATFAAGTYVVDDVYVFDTDGGVTHTGSGVVADPTIAASPLDDYNLLVAITKDGALGTSKFTYSLDGGLDVSAEIIVPAGGAYGIAGSGVVLTFANTQSAGDYWTAQCAAPSFSSTDRAACETALKTTYLGNSSFALYYVDRYATSASAAATEATALQTFVTALAALGKYIDALGAAPAVGSVNISGGNVSIDSADTDSVVATAFASVTGDHAEMFAGDCLVSLPQSGLTLRRSIGLPGIAWACSAEPSRSIGDVSRGGIPVASIFRDETATPGLDDARLITARTFPNFPGIYFTNGVTLALPTSDFASLQNARVVNEASTIARTAAMPYVNAKLETSKKIPGALSEAQCQIIEARVRNALKSEMVDTSPADAVAVDCRVDRTHDVVADSHVLMEVDVQVFATGKFITITLALKKAA